MRTNSSESKKTDALEKGFVCLALYLLSGLLPVFGFHTAFDRCFLMDKNLCKGASVLSTMEYD